MGLFFFPVLLVFLSCAAVPAEASAQSCESLFSTDAFVRLAIRTGLVRDLIRPAVDMYAALKQVAEMTLESRTDIEAILVITDI